MLSAAPGGCRLRVRVAPRSAANRVLGVFDGALKVALTAPPVDGAANKALVEFLSDLLDMPRSGITIESGQTGRDKLLFISGVSVAQAQALVDKVV